jgi:hypothetical protein
MTGLFRCSHALAAGSQRPFSADLSGFFSGKACLEIRCSRC